MIKIKVPLKVAAKPAVKKPEVKTPEAPAKKGVLSASDIAEARHDLVKQCKELVAVAVREYLEGAETRLEAHVDKVLGTGLEKRVVDALGKHFKQEYELCRVPYDTKLAVLQAIMAEGWRLMEVISPQMAKVVPELASGYMFQRIKGAGKSAAMDKAKSADSRTDKLPKNPPVTQPKKQAEDDEPTAPQPKAKLTIKPKLKISIGKKKG